MPVFVNVEIILCFTYFALNMSLYKIFFIPQSRCEAWLFDFYFATSE